MTSYYNRSEILSYFDLTNEQQEQALNDSNDEQHAEERSYVICNGELLGLDNFMRLDNSNIWHGAYGQSYFSAYFIRLNRSNNEALIAYKYW
jgi:hypothetical protein